MKKMMMMSDKVWRSLTHPKAMMEMIGSAMLVGTIQIASRTAPQHAAQAVWAMLAGLTYVASDVSGAHFNPAVTLTHFLRRRCSPRLAAAYVTMQLVGAVVGASLARTVSHTAVSLRPGEAYTWGQAAFGELMCTTILCLTVLSIALRRDVEVHPVFGGKSLFFFFFIYIFFTLFFLFIFSFI